jgi:hypothetical protein
MLRIRSDRGRLREQRGSALILTVGILFVLTTATTAVLQYTSTNARSANHSQAGVTAFTIAEAGVNQGAATLAENPTATSGSQDFEGGSVTWTTTSDPLDSDLWTVTATSTVPNPTGGSPVQRTVTRQFLVTYEPGFNSGNEAWNYIYADSLTLCTTFKNSFSTSSPVFIRGNLCMENSASIQGGAGTAATIGKKVTLKNTSRIGSSASGGAIQNLTVGTGCSTSDRGPWTTPCTASHRVYSTNFSNSVGSMTKPPIDLEGWYKNAKPGPANDCTVGSFPGGFDNDFATNGVPNRSLGTVDLFASTYSCTVARGGTIAYNDVTQRFTVDGVIFIDGDIELGDNDHVVYNGSGVIYASGKIVFTNDTWLCGILLCSTTGWDPNDSMLTLVAGSDTDDESFLIQNSAKFQGAVYAVNDFKQQNVSRLEGPIVARRLIFENGGSDKWVPLTGLTPGMPGAVGTDPVLTVAPDSWID